MKVTKRIILYKSFLAPFMLFVIYGCQTTNSTINTEPPASNPISDKTQPDLEDAEPVVNKTSIVKKETDQSTKAAESEKEHIEKFQKRLFGMMGGHGGTIQQDANEANQTENLEQTADDLTVKPAKPEDRPFKELEKSLYGNWINYKKTESYDFHDDGTVIIVVIGQRSKSYTLNGNYILVEKERIKFDFKNDSFARQMPPRHYKITISGNEFALTDEPKGAGGPDGPTTKYKRIK
ncbi:MAG: hypothetical protein ACYSTS_01355 [Planctomycetota bacterium]